MHRRKFLTRTASVIALALSGTALAQHEDPEGLNYVFIRDQTEVPYVLRIVHFIPLNGELVTARMTPEFVASVIQTKDIPFERELEEYLKYYKFDGTMNRYRLENVINEFVNRLPNKV